MKLSPVLLAGGVLLSAAVALYLSGNGGRRAPHPPLDAGAIESAPAGTVFFGGDETDPRDKGRPVKLIAAALGIPDQVFRDAFSDVRPARFGGPTASQARANKKVLMDALGQYGVTNERLDEVSNYYRYNRSRGESWTHSTATAVALITKGTVTGFNITDAGSGYSTPPTVIVAGYPHVKVNAKLRFGTDLRVNGSIESLVVGSQQ